MSWSRRRAASTRAPSATSASTASLDLNIAIRTILVKGETAYFQAGGGIVADSDPEMEYQETLDKASALARAVLSEG